MVKALIVLLLISIMPAFADAADLNWEAIRALDGRKSLQDGPNCYNATFVAKGWTSVIAQTSDEELKYYLWNFCERVNDDLQPGDILVQTTGEDRETEHTAVFLSNGLIFEKPSIAGQYGRYAWTKKIGTYIGDLEKEMTYAIRKTGDSDYFHEVRNDYRCIPLAEIKTRVSALHRLPAYLELQRTKKLLSKLSFIRHPKRSEEYKKLPVEIDKVSKIVESLNGDSDQDLFLYANIESVNSHFFNFVDGLMRTPKEATEKDIKPRPYQKHLDRLDMSLRCLIERIRKARTDSGTDFIVRKVRPGAYVYTLQCPHKS